MTVIEFSAARQMLAAQRSGAEEDLARQCKLLRLPEFEREYLFAASIQRKWRVDLAFVADRLAVEIDGGGFANGRHSRGLGIERDAEKYSHLAIFGWRLIRVTPGQVRDGRALKWIEKALLGGWEAA